MVMMGVQTEKPRGPVAAVFNLVFFFFRLRHVKIETENAFIAL